MSKFTVDPHQADWLREIGEAQEQSRQAFLAQDIDRLRLLWSEDLVVNSPINRVLRRDQVLDLLQRGVIRHLSYDEQIERTTRHGEVVIVMGHDVVTDEPDAAPLLRRFTNVWRATGGSWQLIARHASAVRKEEPQ